jgi:hypothetical protein
MEAIFHHAAHQTDAVAPSAPAALPPAGDSARAPRQAVHGTRAATWTGRIAGAAGGVSFGTDAIAASSRARDATPDFLLGPITQMARVVRPVSQPLRQWGVSSVRFLTKGCPSLASIPFAPDKVVDFLVGASATLFNDVPWSYESPFVFRAPGAPYPSQCDRDMPAPGCPDPLSYAIAGAASPYAWALTYGVSGAILTGLVGRYGWPASVRHIAKIQTEYVPTIGSPCLQRIERAAIELIVRAARQACAEMNAPTAAPEDVAAEDASLEALEAGVLQDPEHADDADASSFHDALEMPSHADPDETTPLLPR